MKCHTTERYILLAQSGELSAWRRRRLTRHVQTCSACRRYGLELEGITGAVRDSADQPGVSEAVIERIRAAARRERSRSWVVRVRPSREPFTLMWRPALLYSALGLLLLTGFWLVLRPALQPGTVPVQTAGTKETPETTVAWDDNMDDQISELGETVAQVSGDWTTAETYETQDDDIIARELLQLEGEQI